MEGEVVAEQGMHEETGRRAADAGDGADVAVQPDQAQPGRVGLVLDLEVDHRAAGGLVDEQGVGQVEVDLHGVAGARTDRQGRTEGHGDGAAAHHVDLAGRHGGGSAPGGDQVHGGGIGVDGDDRLVVGAGGHLGRGQQFADAVHVHQVDGGVAAEGDRGLAVVGLVDQGHAGHLDLDGAPGVGGGVGDQDAGSA